ncbi:MAG TPA: hypothetical protein VFZ53_25550, partial [Polyangiaceae bacterium]
AGDEPAPAPLLDAEPTPEPGSSVADILVRLEVAYRQRIAPPPPPLAVNQPAPAPPPAAHVTTVVAVTAPAVAPAAMPAPAAAPLAAAPEPATETESEPVLAARDVVRPRDVHIGDVNRNTTVNNVHQGDVYVVEPYVQYVPYFAGYATPYTNHSVKPRYPAPVLPAPRKVAAPDSYSVFKYPVDLVH